MFIVTISFYTISPTKATVEDFLKVNSCNPYAIETDYDSEYECAAYLRRHTTLLGGQIFSVPKFTFLFMYTPFHYLNYLDPTRSDDDHVYIYVDTRDEGRLVYNQINGRYVGFYNDYYQSIEDRQEMVDKLRIESENKAELELLKEEVIVTRVIDGDTIEINTGERVRLIGINAPEEGEKCYEESKEFLGDFLSDKEITLERDIEDKDQYGRLLRYVFADGHNVNYGIVYLGLAHKYEYGSNTRYSDWFEEAEDEAKEYSGCLWKSEDVNYIQDQCIYITNFHFNAAGNDNYNLNDEYVTFGNKCSYSISMDGWTVKDETASHVYTIPSFTFQSGATFTLYTGMGANTNSALYWGRTSGDYAAIWNNNGGDTLFLRDSNGNLVLSQSYLGY